MTRSPPGALERVERELERIGLLLEHDKELPSVTLLVAGELSGTAAFSIAKR
jgi:hypothetical protein